MVEQLSPNSMESSWISRHRRLAATGLSVTIGGSALVGAAGGIFADDPLYYPAKAIEYITQNECPPTPGYLIRDVRRALSEDRGTMPNGFREHRTYVRNEAARLGLTVFEWETFDQQLWESETIDSALNIVNGFLSNYSISLEIPTEVDLRAIDVNYKTADRNDINSDDFKLAMSIFLETFSRMPKELVDFSGLKKISIVELIDTPDNEIAGKAHGRSHQIFLDFNSLMELPTPEYFAHEIGHLLDYVSCGSWGSKNDRQYSGLNPPEFIYGITKDEEGQYVTRNYGTGSVTEDKATLYEQILIGWFRYSEYSPALQDKAVVLLARLEQKVPNIARYLHSISPREAS